MEIEYGAVVVDKNGKKLGKVDYIVMDAWSGEPRKYMVRLEDQDDVVFFAHEQVAEATKKKIKLNISADEIEQT